MVTEYKCEGCNFKKKRFFKKGDFVFQKVGTCRKCGKNVIISAIYEEKMKTKEELKWEREEAKWR
jgi:rRNA maturation endonuclease Nob1